MANGRLNSSGVVQLAPHLSTENADELLGAAAGRSEAQIERLIAEVLDRALDALIAKLEQQRFSATERPRAGR